jgi:hypothetical protein
MADEEEEDYLHMTFTDPTPRTQETSLQRTARLKREAAQRAKIAPKAEREATAKEKLEAGLATAIDHSSKGARMMAKMGFTGGALGKSGDARTTPIGIQVKEDRGGIGMENDRKRKLREAAEALGVQEKKVRLSETDYRERSRLEREEKRQDGQWWAAMRILEGFEEDDEEVSGTKKAASSTNPPIRSVNLYRRYLVKARLEQERERRMRHDLQQSLSRRTDYTEEDADDHLAYGTEVEELLDDDDDPELDQFMALPVAGRLDATLAHLRERFHYCFWCKFRYSDEAMDGCPGVTEDEHG